MVQRLARRASHRFFSLAKVRACAAAMMLAGLGLAGCAQQPQQLAAAGGHSKEYFPSSTYGRVSPRVVADGQPIPRGGGQYLVGKPYTVAGQTYYPSERRVTQIGLASWYGDAFHGRLTANGEIYDRDSFTAAHPTMPLPSYARVTNLRNNSSMIVRVNDRGPYHSNRVMDVSRRVADALDIRRAGTAKVKVEWVARASLAGSDDAKLAATLRTDGPARVEGVEERIMVAANPAPARVASLGDYAPARQQAAEDERPERLEAYRAPRPARAEPRRAERQDFAEERDEMPTSRIRSRTDQNRADQNRADHAGPRRTIASHDREPHEAEPRHAAPRMAERETSRRSREARVEHAERSAPMLRHASADAARVLPPARPARLAAVLPPPRPSTMSGRHPRPRAD